MSTRSLRAHSPQITATTNAVLEDYYRFLDPSDLASIPPEEQLERVQAHVALAQERVGGEVNIEVVDLPDSSLILIVTDDMPFLVDSVIVKLVREDLAIRQVIHPTFIVTRESADGLLSDVQSVPSDIAISSGDTATLPNLSSVKVGAEQSTRIESWIAVEVNKIEDPQRAGELIEGLHAVLTDVRLAVQDWSQMRFAEREALKSLDALSPAQGVSGVEEAKEFLTWLDQGNFTYLGYREYELENEGGHNVLKADLASGLGVLRDAPTRNALQHLTRKGDAKAREKQPLIITKANSRSTVHRGGYLDYVGVKKFDAEGNVTGERRFIGLFATRAYTASVKDIPVIKEKVVQVLGDCGFPADSHSGKDLVTILESYPRDELFQMSVEQMQESALGILSLQERRRTRVFTRSDIYERFVSILIYLPRDRYNTGVQKRIESAIAKIFVGDPIEFEPRMSDSALTRLFFRIRLTPGAPMPTLKAADLEKEVAAAVRSWAEGIEEVSREHLDIGAARELSRNWAEAFPTSYRVNYEVEDAIEDIAHLEQAAKTSEPVLKVYVPADADVAQNQARAKVYLSSPLSLTRLLPVLQNMGLEVLDERPFDVRSADGKTYYIYDLGLKFPSAVDPLGVAALLEDAFVAATTGKAESDSLDRLILAERLGWREVAVLRAYAKYLGQLGTANSYAFIADVLVDNPAVARALIRLFDASFNPEASPEEAQERIEREREGLAKGLEAVSTLDADRLLRAFSELVEATLRTNFYQNKPYFSFKINTRAISGAPSPRPQYEVWVYSPQVEGVHLRFGKIARGGLRWSDRREDFRTEILGLVKAQTVKNAVIVPTGAKGGFFPKRLPNPAVDRNAWLEEGQASYVTFIKGLLDITDNLRGEGRQREVVRPEKVVAYDDEDTYLVVAADKGTATFSDLANSIALEYGFWLGDAFASGGSVGYDHKAMAITARGAWESVKWHFSELDLDTQKEDFSVVGIGDMSGDVFGNGMLLSEHIQLVAAFDHRHIFLDPNPDVQASFAERRRMFQLPRSSWEDYNPALISEGGGVFARSAKTVPISAQVRERLGLATEIESMSPPELLQAILKAPVDLLYNGGIGTYVKSSEETNVEVGDKTNDGIRINGNELRAKVVGEGGNLGLTQRGRIEAAQNGVLINTDAIDNSAGVDCSDHEVNIKILVDQLVEHSHLDSAERAGFIESMTDDVAQLVLADNVEQNVLLLNDKARVAEWGPSFARFMDWLEERADLDRELEALPSNQELEQRSQRGEGLSTPELSVLSAYAKIELAKALAASDLAEDEWFEANTLRDYFPQKLGERFASELIDHPLRKEIIATAVANDIINLGGITFAFRVMEETSVTEETIARAFVALNEIYGFKDLQARMTQLPAEFPTEEWAGVNLDMRRLIDRTTRWFIHNVAEGTGIREDIARFEPAVVGLSPRLREYLRGVDRERADSWYARGLEVGLPADIALQWATQFESFSLLDIAVIAERAQISVERAAEIYYLLFSEFGADALLERITGLPRDDRWQALARAALRDDLYTTLADITMDVARTEVPAAEAQAHPEELTRARVDRWLNANRVRLARTKDVFDEVSKLSKDEMASLSVAMRSLRSVVRR